MPTEEEMARWRQVSGQGTPEPDESPPDSGVRPGDKNEGWHPTGDEGLPPIVDPSPEGEIAGPEQPSPVETPGTEEVEDSGNVQNNPAP